MFSEAAHDARNAGRGVLTSRRGENPRKRSGGVPCARFRGVARLRFMPAETAYFLSDAHLGTESAEREAPREARLIEFFESLPGRAESLFIVGDLFDFWFEYSTAIPRRHFKTLCALRRLREAGVEITYLAGNHDFWLGGFLSNELGIHTREGPVTVEKQGRRAWIHHGDGLIGGDLGYRMLKKILRNRVNIRLYRWLHPDLGIPLAHWV